MQKKCVPPLAWFVPCIPSGFSPLLSVFLLVFIRLPFAFSSLFIFSCLGFPSKYGSFIRSRTNCPERSRSRDEPMWHHRHPQHRNQYRDAWHEVPAAPRLRKVLIIIDLVAVRPLMNKVHDDVMDSTTCDVLPSLSRTEERALFTYNVLVDTNHLDTLTVSNLLYITSQHIWWTWDRYLSPSSMDLRWQDETGDTFALRDEDRVLELLHEYRPHWTEGQEFGTLFPNTIQYFTSHYPAIHYAYELPWGSSQSQHASITWIKMIHSFACCLLLFLVSVPMFALGFPFLSLPPFSSWLQCTMTKRDSLIAGITSSSAPMSMPRRHSRYQDQSRCYFLWFKTSTEQYHWQLGLTIIHSPPPSHHFPKDQELIIVAVYHTTGTWHLFNLYPCLLLLPIRLLSSPLLKKHIHSRRRSNNGIGHSILTSSQRFPLLKRESVASWWPK